MRRLEIKIKAIAHATAPVLPVMRELVGQTKTKTTKRSTIGATNASSSTALLR